MEGLLSRFQGSRTRKLPRVRWWCQRGVEAGERVTDALWTGLHVSR